MLVIGGRGRASLEDNARSGRPLTATLPEKVDKVRLMVEKNPRVTIEDIEGYIGIGSAAVQSIIHEHLGLRKLAARWVPHFLTDTQKKFGLIGATSCSGNSTEVVQSEFGI